MNKRKMDIGPLMGRSSYLSSPVASDAFWHGVLVGMALTCAMLGVGVGVAIWISQH